MDRYSVHVTNGWRAKLKPPIDATTMQRIARESREEAVRDALHRPFWVTAPMPLRRGGQYALIYRPESEFPLALEISRPKTRGKRA